MKNLEEIRNLARVGNSAGLTSQETREILDGSLFSESDIGVLRSIKDSLKDPTMREGLLDVLTSRSQDRAPFTELIDALYRFFVGLKRRFEEGINENDVKLLRFAVKYFEDWFYRGNWVEVPKREEEKQYAYFFIPAGLLNMIAKVKEEPKYAEKLGELGNFDRKRLEEFQEDVHRFALSFLSPERLEAILASDASAEEKSAAENMLKNREAILQTFLESEQAVKKALMSQDDSAKDVYFLKHCLIAAEMLRRKQSRTSGYAFTPDRRMDTSVNKAELFDFSKGEDPSSSSMHYPTFNLPYAKFVVEYLRQRSA